MDLLIEHIPLPIVVVDPVGRIEMCNPAFERLFLYHQAEILGAPLSELLGMEETNHEWAQLGSRVLNGEVAHFTSRRRRKNGKLLDVEIYYVPLLDKERLIGAFAVFQDLSARKRTEQALRESGEKFRQIADNIEEVFFLRDAAGNVLYVNPAYERLWGRTRKSVYREPMSWLEAVHCDDRERLRATVERTWGQRKESQAEFRVVRPDATVRWVWLHVVPIADPQGGLHRVMGVCLDITAQKRAESALQQLSGRLLRMQDEERRRIARELHDTTVQALAALAMNLTRLENSLPPLDPKDRNTLSDSIALAEQCAREIRSLSYLLHPPLLDEVGLAGALKHYVEGFTQRSGVQMALEVSPEVGRLPREIEMTVFRVVQESLSNLLRHSESPRGWIRLAHAPNELRLEVRDEGKGMPRELREHLNGNVELGVGIAGMRERLRQLGGGLEILPGNPGTVVKATLPLPGGDHG